MASEDDSFISESRLKTNPALIEGLKSSQDWAWREFRRLYVPRLIGWARGRGFNSSDAEEFLGEVLKRLAQSLRGFEYDPSRSFRGYLRTVLHSVIAAEVQRRSRSGEVYSLDDLDQPVGALGMSVLDIVVEKELDTHLIEIRREVLDSVSEVERAVWIARDRNLLSVDELAHDFGISKQTVYRYKSQVSHQMHQRILEITGSHD